MPLGRRVLIRNAALLAAAQGCARRIDPAPVVGVSEDNAGHVVIAPSAAPQLQKKGGAVAVHVVNGGFTLLVVNLGPELLAFDGSCPHAGCDLTWVPEDREVECPCHGSRFASDGVVLQRPATTDLNTYPVTVDASGNVVVALYPGDGTYPKPDAQGKLTLDLANYPALAPVNGSVLGGVEFPPGRLLLLGSQMPSPQAVRLLVVKLPTVEIADGVMQWPATRSLVAERLGPLAVVVAEENLEAFRAALAEVGVRVNVE